MSEQDRRAKEVWDEGWKAYEREFVKNDGPDDTPVEWDARDALADAAAFSVLAAALAQARREGERIGQMRGLQIGMNIAVEECGNAFGFEDRLRKRIVSLEQGRKAANEPEFWGHPDQERLSATDEDDAIEAILDDMEPPFPEKITVAGFAKTEVDISKLDPLERVLEYMDEEYGDPDGDPSKPTEAMRRAEGKPERKG